MTETAALGKGGPLVSRIGYGAMVLEGYYGAADDNAALDTLAHASEIGMMFDTADAYGGGHNEELIARALKKTSSTPFIATKFGVVFDPNEPGLEYPNNWGLPLRINTSADYAKRALEGSLRRLQVDAIDLWYAHYIGPDTPVEETVSAMAQAVNDGKVRYIGLSNATADDIRRAHAVHPIAAVQYEYSLSRREAETDLLPTLRELGIALVAWSPLGSGFLSGIINDIGEGDARSGNPRFNEQNLQTNISHFAPLKAIADELNITTAQLALAWLLHQGKDIFPIPGSRKLHRLDENAAAAAIKLDDTTLNEIDRIAAIGSAQGQTLI